MPSASISTTVDEQRLQRRPGHFTLATLDPALAYRCGETDLEESGAVELRGLSAAAAGDEGAPADSPAASSMS